MDKFLKLKLEMVYRGMSVEQARQHFDELKSGEPPKMPVEVPVVKVRRKLRIPAADKPNE
jgi:hypothetical protein